MSATPEEHRAQALTDTIVCMVVLRGTLDQRTKRPVLTIKDVHKLSPDELAALFEETEGAHGVGGVCVPLPPIRKEETRPATVLIPPPQALPPNPSRLAPLDPPEGRGTGDPASAPPEPNLTSPPCATLRTWRQASRAPFFL